MLQYIEADVWMLVINLKANLSFHSTKIHWLLPDITLGGGGPADQPDGSEPGSAKPSKPVRVGVGLHQPPAALSPKRDTKKRAERSIIS